MAETFHSTSKKKFSLNSSLDTSNLKNSSNLLAINADLDYVPSILQSISNSNGNTSPPNPISRSSSFQSLSPSNSFKTISPSISRAVSESQYAHAFPSLISNSSSSVAVDVSFHGDFILISEFSELDGPIPLFTIPEGAEGRFDLNEFVLRITAVDYQNSSTDLNSFIGNDVDLRDTQVVMTHASENATAYIHHFTLLDLYARGYVRPLTMSYITHDSKKIMNHFTDFFSAFNKISNVFKAANRMTFKRDLEIRIKDVQLTHKVVMDQQEKLNKSNEVGSSNQVESDEDKPITAKKFMESDDYMPLPTPNTVSEYMHDLKLLHKKMKGSKMNADDKSKNSESSDDETAVTKTEEFSKPQILQSIQKTNYLNNSKKELRTLEQLCEYGFLDGLDRLVKAQTHFSRPQIVLLLEQEDETVLNPSATLLSSGNNVLMNFNFASDRKSRNMHYESSDQTEISENVAPIQNVPTQFRTRARTMSISGSKDKEFQPGSSSADQSKKLYHTDWNEDHEPAKDMAFKIQSRLSLDLDKPTLDASAAERVKIAAVSSLEAWRVENEISHPLSIVPDWDDDVMAAPKYQDSEPRLESFSTILWGNSNTFWGKGLFELKKFSFFKHIAFSLLKGRTVVVTAQNQNEMSVKRAVAALSIFVVGSNRKRPSVINWQTVPLKLSDLSTAKLIGLSKSVPLPKTVERYVTLFDIESEVLVAPSYTGEFIDDILVKKNWPDEDTFLAAVHESLFKIASKACLYYHLCCVSLFATKKENNYDEKGSEKDQSKKSPRPDLSDLQAYGSMRYEKTTTTPSPVKRIRSLSDSNLMFVLPTPNMRENSKSLFFTRMGLQKNDIEIVEYFAEVVKEQQITELHGRDRMISPIKLDYTSCVCFTNSTKQGKRSSAT